MPPWAAYVRADRHRLRVAGGVDHDVEQAPVRQLSETLWLLAVAGDDGSRRGIGVAAELDACREPIHDGHVPGAQPDELQRRQPDRPQADDEHPVLASGRGAGRGVAADGQRLHQRELIVGEPGGAVQLAGRDREAVAEAAVLHDADHAEPLAAVGAPLAARVAASAVQVGLDAAGVAGRHRGDAVADGQHLDAQLVAGDAREVEERKGAVIGADIGAAHADRVRPHQRLTRPWWRGRRHRDGAGLVRGLETDRADRVGTHTPAALRRLSSPRVWSVAGA